MPSSPKHSPTTEKRTLEYVVVKMLFGKSNIKEIFLMKLFFLIQSTKFVLQTLFNSKINASYNIRIIVCLVQISYNHGIVVEFLVAYQCPGQWFLFFDLRRTVCRTAVQLNIACFRLIIFGTLLSAPSQGEEASQFLTTINALDNVDQNQLNSVKKFRYYLHKGYSQ